jgi:hypothetical protein
VPSNSRRAAAPDERVHNVPVGLAGANASYRHSGREDNAARSAVGAAAMAAERGAHAVTNERGREARGSLGQPNERTERARGAQTATGG